MDKPKCNNSPRPDDFQPASIDLDISIYDVMYLDIQKLFDKVPYREACQVVQLSGRKRDGSGLKILIG